MTHEGQANLISLGLSSSFTGEDSSIRWWLAWSLAIHALAILFLTTLRFAPSFEQPLHSYEVSLINPSDLKAPPAKSRTKTKSRAKAKQSKARPTPPPKPKTLPPEPKVEPLSPLPTQTASERLSESFAGAVKSVVIPDRLTAPAHPETEPSPTAMTETETPNVLENIKLPKTAPKLARAQRLERQHQVSIPEPTPEPSPAPRQSVPSSKAPTPAPPNMRQENEKTLQSIKAPPEAPTLNPIQPFRRSKRKDSPKPKTEKLSDTFRKSIQSVKVPKSRAKARTKKTPNDPALVPPSTPKAPQLTQVTPTTKQSKSPEVKQERLADSLKQVLGTVKIPKLRNIPNVELPQQSTPEPSRQAVPETKATPDPESTGTESLKSEIDRQLAKLTIPDVAPIESLKERLQVQVETSDQNTSSGASSSKNSQGQNRYLALIEAKIEQKWVAPRVSIAQDHPQVILKFRILPTGEVTNLGIKQGSGNEYYDAAARRAVKAASPLPPFPKDLTSSYLDLLYKFRIGESNS